MKERRQRQTRSGLSLPSNSGTITDMKRSKKPATSSQMNSIYFQVLAAGLLFVCYEWYAHFQVESIETPIELSCKNSTVWASDVLWKTSVTMPQICPPKRGEPVIDLQQKGLDAQQLQETIYHKTPCGAYCAYLGDGKETANAVIAGWVLIDRSGKGSRGCWEPVLDLQKHDCSKWYNDWKAWIVEVGTTPEEKAAAKRLAEVEAEKKRIAEEAEKKRLAEEAEKKRIAEAEEKRRADAMASIPEKMNARCSKLSIWKENTFWKNSVLDPSVCDSGVPGQVESLNLGVSYLVDSLVITQCGSPCVYHLESSPITSVADQRLKGWSLGEHTSSKETKGCFTPIPDVRESHCNQWYETWVMWVNNGTAGS